MPLLCWIRVECLKEQRGKESLKEDETTVEKRAAETQVDPHKQQCRCTWILGVFEETSRK
jgi:hypothetical protein